MTEAHQTTLLELAREHGIEANPYSNYQPIAARVRNPRRKEGKTTAGVVVEKRSDIDTLTALFINAAAKPKRFTFQWDNLGREFIIY